MVVYKNPNLSIANPTGEYGLIGKSTGNLNATRPLPEEKQYVNTFNISNFNL